MSVSVDSSREPKKKTKYERRTALGYDNCEFSVVCGSFEIRFYRSGLADRKDNFARLLCGVTKTSKKRGLFSSCSL